MNSLLWSVWLAPEKLLIITSEVACLTYYSYGFTYYESLVVFLPSVAVLFSF